MSAKHRASPERAHEVLVTPRLDTAGSLELLEAVRRENEQLRTALVTRIVIEQAKGVLAERWQVQVDLAFERLRREARNRRMKLHVLAAAVVAGEPWTRTVFPPRPEGDPR